MPYSQPLEEASLPTAQDVVNAVLAQQNLKSMTQNYCKCVLFK